MLARGRHDERALNARSPSPFHQDLFERVSDCRHLVQDREQPEFSGSKAPRWELLHVCYRSTRTGNIKPSAFSHRVTAACACVRAPYGRCSCTRISQEPAFSRRPRCDMRRLSRSGGRHVPAVRHASSTVERPTHAERALPIHGLAARASWRLWRRQLDRRIPSFRLGPERPARPELAVAAGDLCGVRVFGPREDVQPLQPLLAQQIFGQH